MLVGEKVKVDCNIITIGNNHDISPPNNRFRKERRKKKRKEKVLLTKTKDTAYSFSVPFFPKSSFFPKQTFLRYVNWFTSPRNVRCFCEVSRLLRKSLKARSDCFYDKNNKTNKQTDTAAI